MEYYPDGEHAALAMKRIRAIDSGEALPDEAAGGPHTDQGTGGAGGHSADDLSGPADMLDFDDTATPEDGPVDPGAGRTALSDEMDDFLSNPGAGGADDRALDDMAAGSVFEMSDSAGASMSRGSYSTALDLYRKILSMNKNSNPEEKKIFEEAHFNAGRCLMELKKSADALDLFSKILRNFPSSPYLKNAIFNIGIIFESANQKEKAITYFNKVLNMPPRDKLNSDALTKIKILQGK